MPRVPTYDSQQVQPQNLPDARQQAPNRMAMGEANIPAAQEVQLGRSMTAIGGEMMAEARRQQIENNENATKATDADFVKQADAVMFGSTDADGKYTPGFTEQKGQQAVDNAGAAVDNLRKIQQQAVENAPNDAVRRLVQATTDQRINAYSAAVAKHAGGQQVAANDQASEIRATAANDSTKKAYDPIIDGQAVTYDPAAASDPSRSLYQQQLGTVLAERTAQAQNLPPEVRDQYVKDGMAKTYAGVVMHLANIGQTQQAKDYLDRLQQADALPQDAADKIKQLISPDLTADKVLRYSDNLFDTVKGEKTQLAQVRKDFEAGTIDGNERQLIERRVKQAANEAEANDNKWTAQAVGQAQDYFLKNPGKSVLDLAKENPALYRALELKGHLAALDSFSQREARVKSDPIVQHNIDMHFGTGDDMDVTRMKEADWMLLRGQLSSQDWTHYDRARSNQINGVLSGKDDPGNLNLKGYTAALNSRLIGIGVDVGKLSSKTAGEADKAYVGAINQYAREWVLQDQAASGRPFNQEETAKSLDKLFAKDVTFRNTFIGIPTGTSSQRLMSMKIGDLPDGAKDGIKNSLIKAGNQKPTDQDILMQYWRLHAK